jgi:hypothetical protein
MFSDIELFESRDLIQSGFCLWGWMKRKVYKRKADAQHELPVRILVVAVGINKRENPTQTNNTRSSHELRSAVRLTVGFSKIYCEL